MPLPELLTLCTFMGDSWQFSESGLMTPLLLCSKKLLRLSPLIPLIFICKSIFPNRTMIHRLWIIMPLKEPKSKLIYTSWRLVIKLRRSSSRFFEPIIPILRLKKIKQGTFVLSSLPNILQAFFHHYENIFSLQGNLIPREEALKKCNPITPNFLVVEKCAF